MAAYTANDPVHPEDGVQIGSIGKQFVAAAMMLLVEDGKMSRDEKASAYLGPLHNSWNAITRAAFPASPPNAGAFPTTAFWCWC